MRLLRSLALCLALLMLAGCSSQPVLPSPADTGGSWTQLSEEAENANKREELVVSMPRESGVWDPLRNPSRTMAGLFSLVFEPLVQLDAQQRPALYLAQNITALEKEENVYHVTVRQVTLHDGEKLTAQDVAFTLDRIDESGKDGNYAWVLEYIQDWEIVDEDTISITSDAGYRLMYALTFPIVHQQSNEQLSGSGPYTVAQYERDACMTLQARQDWWRTPPTIQTIRAVAATDDTAALNAFSLGEVDMTMVRQLHVTEYLGGDVNTLECMTQQFELLAMNMNKPAFQSLAVRQAVSYLVDTKTLALQIYQGHATMNDVPVPTDSWLYATPDQTDGVDPETAHALLMQQGFVDHDGDGLFDQMNPETLAYEPVTWTLLTNSDSPEGVRREAAVLIAESLQAAGVKVQVEASPMDDVLKKLEDGAFDLFLGGYQIGAEADLSFLFPQAEEGQSTTFGYSGMQMQTLLQQAQAAQNAEEYAAALTEAQELIRRDIPFIGIGFRTATLLYRDFIQGVTYSRENAPFADLQSWSLN